MAGQWVGALGTIVAVGVALWLAQRDRRRNEAERRDREASQARLVTIAVDYSDYAHPHDYEYAMARVVITNHGEQRVLRPEAEQISGARPQVHWGRQVPGGDEEPLYSPPEVLLPLASHFVPFEHIDADGRLVDPTEATDKYKSVEKLNAADNLHISTKITAVGKIKKWVDVNDVTITFTDMSGLRWRRTGNREPIRVVQPAPADPPKP